MLSCRLSLLPDTAWDLEQGQRVRVHLGTAEVLARTALFEADRMVCGEEGWAQLRLEEPILARTRDHFVLRSYSPVTTIGGGQVAEVAPRKRRRLGTGEDSLLGTRLGEAPSAALSALLEMAEWTGIPHSALPQRTGFSPDVVSESVKELDSSGAIATVEGRLFSIRIWNEGEDRILKTVEDFHKKRPLKSGIPLEEVRQVLPGVFGPKLAEAILQSLQADGRLVLRKGLAGLSGFRPALTSSQEEVRARLEAELVEAGLAPPGLRELAESFGSIDEVESILRLMEAEGQLVNLDREFFFSAAAVRRAGESVVDQLAGATDLGPADFREILPVTRKHLLPLLRYFDLMGITTRLGDGREVASELPKDWGTFGRSHQ
jgi:selenocysteine-specific elongation factor